MIGGPKEEADQQETGFTLMELLVGLALTGLVVGFLAAGLSLLVDFRAHNSAEHEAIVQQEQLSRLLRHDLQLIGKGRGISPMTGTPNHLRFTTPGGLNRSAQAVSLRIDGGGLRLSSADLHLPHVKGRLSYFGVAHLGADPRWHDQWQRKDRLPDLIRVTFDQSDRLLPLVIRPRLMGDVR